MSLTQCLSSCTWPIGPLCDHICALWSRQWLVCQSHLRHVFVKFSLPLAELIPISQTFSSIINVHDSHVGQFYFLKGSFLTLIARVLLKVECSMMSSIMRITWNLGFSNPFVSSQIQSFLGISMSQNSPWCVVVLPFSTSLSCSPWLYLNLQKQSLWNHPCPCQAGLSILLRTIDKLSFYTSLNCFNTKYIRRREHSSLVLLKDNAIRLERPS